MNNYLDKLNPAQKEAAMHMDGPLLIFAGAGSGKTRVLTYRVARLIEEGVDPYHIIAITFTNKAAKEMRERMSAITPLGEQVWVSTFHAACTRILRREIGALGYAKGFSIYDTSDSLRLLKECIAERNLSDTDYPPRYVASVISSQKNELITPRAYEQKVAGSFRESNIADVYSIYQHRLKQSNALDFDDIIFKTVELLTNHEDIRLKCQNRFRYVLVDEYQDTNHAQYELVRLFSGYAQNLCVVGDDDQSIYGWRGANIENILRFEKDYAGAKVVKLEQNYRSSQVILDAANAVISLNEERADKKLWTENGRGELIRVYEARDERAEGAFVAKTISDGVKEGAKYGDFAILYRTNAQSRGVEDQLVMSGLPYRIFSGVRFYEHMEVKDILAYLKAINNPADDMAHLRIINVPKRGIGNATLDKIKEYASEQGMMFSTAISRAHRVDGLGKKAENVKKFAAYLDECTEFAAENSVADVMKKIIDDTNYMKTIADGTPEGEEREANIKELLAKAYAFENESEDTSLAKFLEDVALVADIDNYSEDVDAVSLMTLHSSKGLEFDNVFMVGFEDYLFPTSKSIDSEDESAMEEERRLCYVGFTRARKQLYISHAKSRYRFDRIVQNPPSRFLDEVPENCMTDVKMYVPERMTRPTPSPSSTRATRSRMSEYSSSAASPVKIIKHASEVKIERKPFVPKLPTPIKLTLVEANPITTKPASAHETPMSKPVLSGRTPLPPELAILARPAAPTRPISTNAAPPDFAIGDNVRQQKYGVGQVIDINPAGADYEVTVQFPSSAGRKKFMSSLSRLEKVED
ncbi:MAG: UvrD-helicase domain-containing protein [Defluviitaleaceae bacterium]|nr:UvrD-helicase domain-containing protein [Defluviitaleaceae bacterium]